MTHISKKLPDTQQVFKFMKRALYTSVNTKDAGPEIPTEKNVTSLITTILLIFTILVALISQGRFSGKSVRQNSAGQNFPVNVSPAKTSAEAESEVKGATVKARTLPTALDAKIISENIATSTENVVYETVKSQEEILEFYKRIYALNGYTLEREHQGQDRVQSRYVGAINSITVSAQNSDSESGKVIVSVEKGF